MLVHSRDLEQPILRTLKAAYVKSPDTILSHIQSCCSSNDSKLRVLAGANVSDQEFAKGDKRLLQIREKLKKDKEECVHNALEFTSTFRTRILESLRRHDPENYKIIEEGLS